MNSKQIQQIRDQINALENDQLEDLFEQLADDFGLAGSDNDRDWMTKLGKLFAEAETIVRNRQGN